MSRSLASRVLENYREGHSAHSGPAVYERLSAPWPHYDANYGDLVAELPRDGAILDVGCGPGALIAWLRARGFASVEGVDLSPGDVEHANAQLGAGTVTLADATEHLRGNDGRYAAIFMKAILEHVRKDALFDLVTAAATGLAPGGVLIVEVPNSDWLLAGHERYMDLTHEIGFTRESLSALLGLAFDDVTVRGSRIAGPTRSQRLLRRPLIWALRRALYVLGEGASDTLFAHRSIVAVARTPK